MHNGYIYLYYTFKKFGNCGFENAQVPVNRVSRFTMIGDKVDKQSEDLRIAPTDPFGQFVNAQPRPGRLLEFGVVHLCSDRSAQAYLK